MEHLWNCWDIKPPATCNVKSELHPDAITELKTVTTNAWSTLNKLTYLNSEAAILSRFLYRYKRIFRHDKGFQNLVKINRALKKYKKLDMLSLISNFNECLPLRVAKLASHAYLPTRQMLQWVLMRLQTFSKLFVRIIQLCQEAGRYIYWKLNLGWSSGYMIFALSLAGRISAVAKFLVLKAIKWYNSMYNYLPYLTRTLSYFDEYNFPTDLKVWLGDINLSPPKEKSSVDKIFEVIDLAGDSDNEGNESDEDVIVDMEGKISALLQEIRSGLDKQKLPSLKPKFASKAAINLIEDEDMGAPIKNKKNSKKRKRKNIS